MGWMDEYQQVDERLREFHNRYPSGRVKTEMVSNNHTTNPGDVILFRAELYRGDELRDMPCAATGYAHQRILESPPPGKDGKPNRHSPEWTSPWETCETSAIGRALANMGFSPKGLRPSFEEVRKADVAAATQESGGVASDQDRGAGVVPNGGEAATPEPPSAQSSEGGSAAVVGLGPAQNVAPSKATVAAPSDAPRDGTALVALLEAVGGSEQKAINAVNKAMHTNYTKGQLGDLDGEDWTTALRLLKGEA